MNQLITDWESNKLFNEKDIVTYHQMTYYLTSDKGVYSKYSNTNLLPLHRIKISNDYTERDNSEFMDRLLSEYNGSVNEDELLLWKRLK